LILLFCLEGNTRAELDWPVQTFVYEDERHQRVVDKLAFTPFDFAYCDPGLRRTLCASAARTLPAPALGVACGDRDQTGIRGRPARSLL
jgi:hypothetical protein